MMFQPSSASVIGPARPAPESKIVARGASFSRSEGADGGAPDLASLEPPAFLGVRPRSRRVSLAVRLSVPLTLALLWWVGTESRRIPGTILASPSEVARAAEELWETGQLGEFVRASLTRAGCGVGLGVSAGLGLGVMSGLWAMGEELIDPAMQMARAVPFLAIVPLFICWFGIDEPFKVILIAMATTFPMYAYSYLGVRNVDRKVIECARSFGVRGWRLLLGVILPAALPSLLMALRICLAISVIALIAAEQVGTTKGIGYMVLLAKQYYRQDYMVLCILMYAGLGLVFDAVIRLLERYTMPWRRHTTVRG